MWARRWRDRASARTDQEGGRQQRRRMVRVRQHQENMWLGGLRRDRAVDQQESHTERPHRRHIMIDIVAAARSRRPRPGPPPRGNSAAVLCCFRNLRLLLLTSHLATRKFLPAGWSCRAAAAKARVGNAA